MPTALNDNMPSDTTRIRAATAKDVPAIVDVHLDSFEGFFLTFLGPAFLRELYTAILEDPSGIVFVEDGVENIRGFVAGTAQPSGLYSRLLRRRWWRFSLAAISPVVRQPSIIPRLLRAFTMPEQVTKQEGHGTLMSIAVLPSAQGNGVGRVLVWAFLDESKRRGLRYVDLTTDRNDNEAVNHFYQKLGFVCQRTYSTPEGRAMNEYVINVFESAHFS